MRFMLMMLFVVFLPPEAAKAQLPAQASGEWSKISIVSAYVSKETFENNRDFMSEAEFGWNIWHNNSLIMRGGLYDDYYAPVSEKEAVHISFVESDLISDDQVYNFKLPPGNGTRELQSGPDRFTLKRSSFFPDANSGSDSIPSGATQLKAGAIIKDTLSFLDGDYTDYYSTLPEPATVVIKRDQWSLEVVTDAHGIDDPTPRKYAVIDLKMGAKQIRLRPVVGTKRTDYSIRAFYGASRTANLAKLLLDDWKNNEPGTIGISDILKKHADADTMRICRAENLTVSTGYAVPCIHYLNEFGTAQDRAKIDAAYEKGDSNVKSAIDFAKSSR